MLVTWEELLFHLLVAFMVVIERQVCEPEVGLQSRLFWNTWQVSYSFTWYKHPITYTTLLTNSKYVEEVSSAIQDCFMVSIFSPKSPKKPALGLIIVPGTNFKIFSNDSMDGRMWRVLNISLAEGKCFLIMGTTRKFRFNHHHNWTLLFWKKLKGHLEWRAHFVPLKILFTSFSSLP